MRRFLKKHHHTLRELFLLVIVLAIFMVGTFFFWISTFTLPDLSTFSQRKVSESTKIYDRTGTVLLFDINQGIRRTAVSDVEISPYLKNATIAIEDTDFYQHHGIKFLSIIRAVLANIGAGGYSQGGSTITQQVVKNSLLTQEKKVSRKIKEWVLSLKLERLLTKTEILDTYLNESPYGGNLYGVEEASKAYFGKHATEVTLAEAAYLAALPNAPSYYSPYGANKKKLDEREKLVLSKMLENKLITQDEYKNALAEKVQWLPQANIALKAPHFVMYVKKYLEDTYGKQQVEQGGLKVITTLDYDLEQKAEEITKKYALQNEKTFNAENAAMVAIDVKTGQILAMVGSRDYFDKAIDGNFNVALAHRQPGSAFKPIVYAEAFTKGYTPDTTLFDLQTEFSTECNPDGTPIKKEDEKKCYRPENYDHVYRGPISLRNALAQSINIPAIKTLYLAGLKDSLKLAKNMGLESLTNTDQYGLTLVLGGGEVTLLDLTNVYATFANSGVRNPSQSIISVTDKTGAILETYTPNPVQVLDEQPALMISDILSDNKARTPAFTADSALYIKERPVAVKTGTTNDYRDAWVVGYTPQIAIGSWAGNNDNSPMEKKVAGFIVAPMWNEFVREAIKKYPIELFKKPNPIDKKTLKPALAGFWQGGEAYFTNKQTGERATINTPAELQEEHVVKQLHSILFWVDKNNPTGSAPQNPDNDPQFKLWEYPIKKWALENNITDETAVTVIPTKEDSVHLPEFFPHITITSPDPNTTYPKNSSVTVTVSTQNHFPVSKVNYFINSQFVGSSVTAPFNFTFTPDDIDGIEATNELRAVVYDNVLNQGETRINFTVAQ